MVVEKKAILPQFSHFEGDIDVFLWEVLCIIFSSLFSAEFNLQNERINLT